MTTTWLIVNIVLAAVLVAVVALPAVLIPLRLDRGPGAVSSATPAARPRAARWAADGRSVADAA